MTVITSKYIGTIKAIIGMNMMALTGKGKNDTILKVCSKNLVMQYGIPQHDIYLNALVVIDIPPKYGMGQGRSAFHMSNEPRQDMANATLIEKRIHLAVFLHIGEVCYKHLLATYLNVWKVHKILQ
ncbi:hypothetical protein SK128_008824 [Halocaridina rubra]|uniref:Uncharacterized protein n=1 Tax=Halocaridina rubra TaxID=373956 RepID=A0AAN8ZZT9_HALRR